MFPSYTTSLDSRSLEMKIENIQKQKFAWRQQLQIYLCCGTTFVVVCQPVDQ